MVKPSYPGKPLPIGYIEKQAGWVGDHAPDHEQKIIQTAIDVVLRENPGYEVYGTPRVDRAKDGGGVPHCTAYIGFAPIHVAAEPLDNRNLNNAPLPQPDGDREAAVWPPMGHREQKF